MLSTIRRTAHLRQISRGKAGGEWVADSAPAKKDGLATAQSIAANTGSTHGKIPVKSKEAMERVSRLTKGSLSTMPTWRQAGVSHVLRHLKTTTQEHDKRGG